MKKFIFLFFALSVFTMNAQEKPSSIRTYIEYIELAPDSAQFLLREFTYDGNGNIVQEIITDYQEEKTSIIERKYDGDNRITFLVELRRNDTIRKETWVYDAVNEKIEHTIYLAFDALSPSEKFTYVGVKDMNAPVEEFNIEVLGFEVAISYLDCDTVKSQAYLDGRWIDAIKIIPTYSNNRISSAIAYIENIVDLIGMDAYFQVNFTHNAQNNLTKIDVSIVPSAIPFPMPIMTVTNSYYDNLLRESTTAIDIAMLGFRSFSQTTYTYNSNNTIVSVSYYNSEDGTNWILNKRDWYDYSLGTPVYVKNELKIFPNPVQDKLQIITEDFPISTVAIYDLTGREVLSVNNVGNRAELNIHNLCKGIYIVKVNAGNTVQVSKFVKR